MLQRQRQTDVDDTYLVLNTKGDAEHLVYACVVFHRIYVRVSGI